MPSCCLFILTACLIFGVTFHGDIKRNGDTVWIMKAVFLSKCQPKGENVLFCESVILLLWYPSILLTPLARYYKDVRILLQIYLFIYFAQRKREKTSPRLKPSFIYLLFCFICLCYYLFIVFILMYKRVMKCIMVGANMKDRSDFIILHTIVYFLLFPIVL